MIIRETTKYRCPRDNKVLSWIFAKIQERTKAELLFRKSKALLAGPLIGNNILTIVFQLILRNLFRTLTFQKMK